MSFYSDLTFLIVAGGEVGGGWRSAASSAARLVSFIVCPKPRIKLPSY